MCIFGGGDGWLLFMGLPLLFIFLSGSAKNDSDTPADNEESFTVTRGQAWVCPNPRCRCPNPPQARFCKRCRASRTV